MALKGDLASVDLAQVFQMLALNKKVGLLSIQSPRLWKVLYFDTRGVTLYYNSHNLLDRTVAAFVRAGRIQSEAVEDLRDHASRNRMGLLEVLLAGGYLAEDELEAQMRYELEEEVYDLFFCKDARFEFFEGIDQLPEREGVVDSRFFFNTESVIMEAARRIDEWSYIAERIANGLEVFCPSQRAFDPEEFGEECAVVYDGVDGRRNVARIVEATGLSSFAVFKSLCALLDAGIVTPLPAEELVRAGQQCAAEGRTNDAINLFEKAIEQGIGVPEVHSITAAAYQRLSEYENAIYHLKCDAEYRIAAGDFRGAAQRLHAAVGLVPTDLSARERLVELALAHSEVRLPEFDAVAEGKELVELLMAAGDLRRVRGLLEGLLLARPEDLDLKRVLVNVHTKAGDQARVIELYESIADTLVRQHKPLEAIGFLQKILMLDRNRADVSERVRSLYALDERTRNRQRLMALLGVLFLLLVGLAVAYHFYDQAADRDFARIDVAARLEASEFALAAAEYEQFITEHPLATACIRANEELARIDSLRRKHEAVLANLRSAREREQERLRLEYQAEWRRHKDLFLAGKPEEALRSIERVRQLITEAGGPEDQSWAGEQQVETTWTKVRSFLERAAELERDGAAQLAAGNLNEAWAIACELVTKYDITAAAKRTRVPVRIVSRPRGAQVLRDGVPLLQDVGGVQEPVTTPAVLMCSSAVETYTVKLDGFETTELRIDPRAQPVFEVPLKVIAYRRIAFPAPVQTPIGAAGDWVVAGLRNGGLAVANTQTGKAHHVIALGGLRAVDGRPVVAGDRAWYWTNEGTLECLLLEHGTLAPGWPVRFKSLPQTELVACAGRLLFVDRENLLHCLDESSGSQLWQQALGGQPAGPPTFEHRVVRVATTDGRVALIDAVEGKMIDVQRSPAGIGTRVFAAGGTMWFGGADGKVRAVDEARGRVLWATDVGRPVADGELLLTRKGLVVIAADNRLVQLDPATGRELVSVRLGGDSQSDLRLSADRVLVVLHTSKQRGQPARDDLEAHSQDDLSVLWEYADTGTFTGAPSVDGRFVAVAGADGEAVLFR